MNKIKGILYILGLPWLYLWIIIVSGLSLFRDNGGHTSGLCSGFMMLGAIAAFVVGVIEFLVVGIILALIF